MYEFYRPKACSTKHCIVTHSCIWQYLILWSFDLIFRHFDGGVLTQSVKYMQKYSGSEYELKVSRCKKEDAGTYLVIAENSFGKREEKASLKVERKNFILFIV